MNWPFDDKAFNNIFSSSNTTVKATRITVGGKVHEFSANEVITIDGVTFEIDGALKITVKVPGDVNKLETGTGNVEVLGNVTGSIETGTGNVKCGKVGGDVVSSTGNINVIGTVLGSATSTTGNVKVSST